LESFQKYKSEKEKELTNYNVNPYSSLKKMFLVIPILSILSYYSAPSIFIIIWFSIRLVELKIKCQVICSHYPPVALRLLGVTHI